MATKQKRAALTTPQDVSRALDELLRLQIERGDMELSLEEEQRKLRAKYDERLLDLAADIAAELKLLLAYLREHKAEFDGPPRSVEFPNGKIGYRLGQPRLKPLSKYTWGKITANIEAAGAAELLNIITAPNRDAILDVGKREGGEDALRAFGLRIVQDDAPYVETNYDEQAHAQIGF